MSKRPGRPPLDPNDPSVRVGTRVTGKTYDELYARAKDARVSISEFIRLQLRSPIRTLKSPTRDPSR